MMKKSVVAIVVVAAMGAAVVVVLMCLRCRHREAFLASNIRRAARQSLAENKEKGMLFEMSSAAMRGWWPRDFRVPKGVSLKLPRNARLFTLGQFDPDTVSSVSQGIGIEPMAPTSR